MGDRAGELFVEVVYAQAQEQRIVRLAWEEGITAERAVRRSGLIEAFPEIASRPLVLGVFGARVPRTRVLQPGERVEICRPLQRDPREARRWLAAHGHVMGEALDPDDEPAEGTDGS